MNTEDQNKKNRMMSYRWLIWVVLVFAYIIVYFHRLATGVVKDDLTNAFGISSITFANLSAMYFYAYMIMQIPSGIMADTIGARKTVTSGILFAGMGSIIFGFAPNITIAFIGRLIVGLGVSVVYVSILKTLSEWFREDEFGTMTGITSFVGNMGGILAQAPLVALVALISWRNTFAAIGLVSVVLAIVLYVIVRNKPEDLGFKSIRELEGEKLKTNKEKRKLNPIAALGTVLKNPRTWPPFFIFMACNGNFITLTGTWGQSYLSDVYGITKSAAANYMSAVIFGLAIGSIIIGKISDKIKKRKISMLIFGVVNLLCWIVIVLKIDSISSNFMWVIMVLIGLSTPSFILCWACGKEVNPPDISGSSTSVINMGGFFGAAILPTIIGSIIDSLGTNVEVSTIYQKAFIVCLVVSIISLVSTIFIKETNCKNIYIQ